MKRFVGLFICLVFMLSFQFLAGYEIIINATSDVEEINNGYYARLWNLDTYQFTQISGTVSQPSTFHLIPGNYVINGYSSNPYSPQPVGHFFYGPADELTIISLTDENPSQTIDIHIEAGYAPQHFITYDIMEINGHDVIPIFHDLVLSIFIKQLVYENDENDIMLIGYQKYTPNGWETTILDEEYLYLDNDAQPGDSFLSHNILFWYDLNEPYLSISSMYVVGPHEIDIEGNTFTSTAVDMMYDSGYDSPYRYWYEFTGNEAPLLRSLRLSGSRTTMNDLDYDNEYDNSKLLDLTPNIEVAYHRFVEQDNFPKNLTFYENTFWWFPPSYLAVANDECTNQIFYWQYDFNNETIIDSVILNRCEDSFLFEEANLLHTNYSFWLKGLLSDGSLSESTNVVSWPSIVSNENDIPAFIRLEDNYPNPFNPETTISFNLDRAEYVSLEIYNIIGQKVKTLVNGPRNAGNHSVVWRGTNDDNHPVSSGIYLYKLKSGKYSSTKKMILLK